MAHMPEEYYINKLLNYIQGTASDEEKARINEWLAKDPERRVFLNQLEQIWQSSAENKQDWDVEASWNRFKEEYGPPEHDNFLLKKKDTKRRTIQNYNQKRRR